MIDVLVDHLYPKSPSLWHIPLQKDDFQVNLVEKKRYDEENFTRNAQSWSLKGLRLWVHQWSVPGYLNKLWYFKWHRQLNFTFLTFSNWLKPIHILSFVIIAIEISIHLTIEVEEFQNDTWVPFKSYSGTIFSLSNERVLNNHQQEDLLCLQ